MHSFLCAGIISALYCVCCCAGTNIRALCVLFRYNVCIMAYGQTGSGKTHTMLGSQRTEGSAQDGVVPKAADELFR